MKFISLIVAYCLTSGYGLFKIKQAVGVFTSAFWLGAFLYGSGFLLWLVILRKFPLSLCFPICAGGLLVMTQAMGYLLLGEPFSALRLFATGLIIVALVLLGIDMHLNA